MTPYLTHDEVNELCSPLKQSAAQIRYLRALLGLQQIDRRPDGSPLVGRKLVEERLNGAPTQATSTFNWSR